MYKLIKYSSRYILILNSKFICIYTSNDTLNLIRKDKYNAYIVLEMYNVKSEELRGQIGY